jgi:enterochelin esterase-like enzyme
MRSTLILAVLGCGLCWGQTDECKPNTLNIPESKYPCVYADGRATFRVIAPDAQKVAVQVGKRFDLAKGPDGVWTVTTTPLVEGFHYYTLQIDGANVADPSAMAYFGSGWPNSGIEIPAKDADFYAAKDVPRGHVREQWYFSKVTNKWRRCFVYTPPDYDTNTKAKYPVLYLMHGWGEDETSWFTQGKLTFIIDNLIAAKKAKPMLIVMDNLNAAKPGESGAIFGARGIVPGPGAAPAASRGGVGMPGGGRGAAPAGGGSLARPTFTETMLTDLIPMVESKYRALAGSANRAMAGLSMGGAQTFGTTLANLDKFSYIGGFSGSCGGRGNFDAKTTCDGAFANAAGFNAKVKVLFLGIGSAEGQGMRQFADALTKNGIKNVVYFESPGTAHEWLTWRRCLYDFAPRLFK